LQAKVCCKPHKAWSLICWRNGMNCRLISCEEP
jgi:hypothetical protein